MAAGVTTLVGLLTAASSLAGLWAAWLWWRASRLPIPDRVPPWTTGRSTGDPQVEALGEAAATVEAPRALYPAFRDATLKPSEKVVVELHDRAYSRLRASKIWPSAY